MSMRENFTDDPAMVAAMPNGFDPYEIYREGFKEMVGAKPVKLPKPKKVGTPATQLKNAYLKLAKNSVDGWVNAKDLQAELGLGDKEFNLLLDAAKKKKQEDKRKYAFPENVVDYQEWVIFDYQEIERARLVRIGSKDWQILYDRLYQFMKDWQRGDLSSESLLLLKANR